MVPLIKWIEVKEVRDDVVRNWLEVMQSRPTIQLIENVQTEVRCIKIAEHWYLPVTINDKENNNSYVVSPYNAYVPYAEEELIRKVKSSIAVACIKPIIRCLDAFLKWTDIDRVIHINNFIFSTNPYGDWQGEHIEELVSFLTGQFPKHLLIFRSLNHHQHKKLLQVNLKAGFSNIVSRQVYMFQPDYKAWVKHKNNGHDRRRIKKEALKYVDHQEMGAHLEDALQLYNQLYLQKYSIHNPRFTIEYFSQCYKRKLIYFQGYKDKDGKLVSFSGLFIYGNTITSPLVGYNTALPQEKGLYLHAIQLIFDFMLKTGLMLNLSSGASNFKKLRGGKPTIEYSSIYSAHLSAKTKLMTLLLWLVSNKIGKPLLEKYEL